MIYKLLHKILTFFLSTYGNLIITSYFEYLSWISTVIATFAGFLLVFISIHYQNDLLSAKQLLRKLKSEKYENCQLVINKLKEYFFLTTDGLNGYIMALRSFSIISYVLVVLWIYACIGYYFNISALGVQILIILSTLLLLFTIISINKFLNFNKKQLILFPKLLRFDVFSKTLSKEYDIVLDILEPIFNIEILYNNYEIHYNYKCNINLTNYNIALSIQRTSDSDFYYNLGLNISLDKSNMLTIQPITFDKNIACNSILFEQLGKLSKSNCECYLTIVSGDLKFLYSADLTIDSFEEYTSIKILPKAQIKTLIPIPLRNFINSLNSTAFFIDSYQGKPTKSNQCNTKLISIIKNKLGM